MYSVDNDTEDTISVATIEAGKFNITNLLTTSYKDEVEDRSRRTIW